MPGPGGAMPGPGGAMPGPGGPMSGLMGEVMGGATGGGFEGAPGGEGVPLSVGNKKGSWQPEEHKAFESLLKVHGTNFVQVAKGLGNRTKLQVGRHAKSFLTGKRAIPFFADLDAGGHVEIVGALRGFAAPSAKELQKEQQKGEQTGQSDAASPYATGDKHMAAIEQMQRAYAAGQGAFPPGHPAHHDRLEQLAPHLRAGFGGPMAGPMGGPVEGRQHQHPRQHQGQHLGQHPMYVQRGASHMGGGRGGGAAFAQGRAGDARNARGNMPGGDMSGSNQQLPPDTMLSLSMMDAFQRAPGGLGVGGETPARVAMAKTNRGTSEAATTERPQKKQQTEPPGQNRTPQTQQQQQQQQQQLQQLMQHQQLQQQHILHQHQMQQGKNQAQGGGADHTAASGGGSKRTSTQSGQVWGAQTGAGGEEQEGGVGSPPPSETLTVDSALHQSQQPPTQQQQQHLPRAIEAAAQADPSSRTAPEWTGVGGTERGQTQQAEPQQQQQQHGAGARGVAGTGEGGTGGKGGKGGKGAMGAMGGKGSKGVTGGKGGTGGKGTTGGKGGKGGKGGTMSPVELLAASLAAGQNPMGDRPPGMAPGMATALGGFSQADLLGLGGGISNFAAPGLGMGFAPGQGGMSAQHADFLKQMLNTRKQQVRIRRILKRCSTRMPRVPCAPHSSC